MDSGFCETALFFFVKRIFLSWTCVHYITYFIPTVYNKQGLRTYLLMYKRVSKIFTHSTRMNVLVELGKNKSPSICN